MGVLASCSKKDDNKTTNPLIGTWDIVSVTLGGQAIILDDCDRKSYAKVSEATYELVSYELDDITNQCEQTTSKGVYSVSGNIMKTTEEGTGEKGEKTYVVSGNTLTLTGTEDGQIVVQTYKKR